MKKKLLIIILSIVVLLLLIIFIPFIVLRIKTNKLYSDYSYLKDDSVYSKVASVEGVELVPQHISCGYATIEMLSSFYGDRVTEDELDSRNKSISTSSSNGFLKEVNKSIPSKEFVKRDYLKNDELLKEIHDALSNGNPVAIIWAALYEDEWTLHFSVVTSLDISNDIVTINNPYGYIETINIDEFLSRTSFKSFTNMPLFLKFGFAFKAFEKNTIFYAK